MTNKFKVLHVMGRKLSFPPPCLNSNQSYLRRGQHDQPEHQRGGLTTVKIWKLLRNVFEISLFRVHQKCYLAFAASANTEKEFNNLLKLYRFGHILLPFKHFQRDVHEVPRTYQNHSAPIAQK